MLEFCFEMSERRRIALQEFYTAANNMQYTIKIIAKLKDSAYQIG